MNGSNHCLRYTLNQIALKWRANWCFYGRNEINIISVSECLCNHKTLLKILSTKIEKFPCVCFNFATIYIFGHTTYAPSISIQFERKKIETSINSSILFDIFPDLGVLIIIRLFFLLINVYIIYMFQKMNKMRPKRQQKYDF